MYLTFSLSFAYLWNRNVSSTFLIIYYTLESASHMTYPFSQAIIEDLTDKSCYNWWPRQLDPNFRKKPSDQFIPRPLLSLTGNHKVTVC